MNIILAIVLACCFAPTQAQPIENRLIDKELEQRVLSIMADDLLPFDDIDYAGLVVLKPGGELICNVALAKTDSLRLLPAEANLEEQPCVIARPVLLLSMLMEGMSASMEFETGIYVDSTSRCYIKDLSAKWTEPAEIPLSKCLDVSDVGMIRGVEYCFQKDMKRYRRSMIKTGILLQDEDEEMVFDNEKPDNMWSPCEIIGRRQSSHSLMQDAVWMNAVMNDGNMILREGETDSKEPFYKIKSQSAVDSLKLCLQQIVDSGTGRRMKVNGHQVLGFTNAIQLSRTICVSFAAGALPGRYTVCCYIRKQKLPAGRGLPAEIVSNVLNYLARKEISNTYKYHPAEK